VNVVTACDTARSASTLTMNIAAKKNASGMRIVGLLGAALLWSAAVEVIVTVGNPKHVHLARSRSPN